MADAVKPLRVLIVEDEEDDALLVVRELRRAGHEPTFQRVETAAQMAAALSCEPWDVIVSDFSLPQFSGPEALALMKEKKLDLPFIMVSRVIGEEAAVAALKAGAHDFIMKRNLARLAPAVEREVREAQVRKDKTRAARDLEESEARYRELADSLPEAVFETGQGLRVTFLNKTGLDLFGYTEDDLAAGLNALDLFAPVDRERARENARRVENGEFVGVNPYRAARKDGSVFPILVHSGRVVQGGQAVGLRGVMVDVTELHRVERERSRLAKAVEQTGEAVVIADPEGNIQYVNPAFEAITGHAPHEAIGNSLSFLSRGVEADDGLAGFDHAVASGCPWTGHLVGLRKDGSSCELECSLSPMRDRHGAITNYVAVCRDVTEQLRLERQFRQAQKLESLGTLAGGIAHDFNNILTPIIGYAQLLLDGIDGPVNDEQCKDLERIVGAGVRAQDLIGQILAFSREVEQPLRPVRLAPLIQETLKLMKASLPATVEIREEIETDQDTVLADPTRLHQVLVNLCSNAGLAMEKEPGVLAVTLDTVEADAVFVAQNPELEEGSYLRLTVTDTGCGMSPETVERIFEPFFSTRKDRGGTGLGLAAVHGIVKSLNGAIRVYSEPNRGTTFRIYLPHARGTAADATAEAHPIPGGTERILFVDDEDVITALGRKMLESLGYTVLTATSGEDALQLFHMDPAGVDLLITDQNMPLMTGQSLIQRVRRLRPDLPTILTTGFSRVLPAAETAAAGSPLVLSKPMTKRELAKAVRQALSSP